MSALPVSQNVPALPEHQQYAAEFCAADKLSEEEIAREVGIDRRTLWRWRKQPAFAAEIERLREVFRQQAMDRAVFADKRARVVALNGVASDLLAQLSKSQYQHVTFVTDDGESIYGFDTARLKEFREYLDDIAEEMGDRQAKGNSATASTVVKVYLDPRMENPIEADWHDAPPPRSSADA